MWYSKRVELRESEPAPRIARRYEVNPKKTSARQTPLAGEGREF